MLPAVGRNPFTAPARIPPWGRSPRSSDSCSQRRHIGAVVLRRQLEELRDLGQGELGQECGNTCIVLADTVVDSHPIQIGDDVVCLPGKLIYGEALDFKAVIRRNLMPQPVDPINIGMAVIERDVDFIVEIFVLHVDAMLFLLHHAKA